MWAVLLMVLAQVPVALSCLPGETTVVCNCKAGQATACEVLRQSEPEKFVQVQKLLKAAMEARKLEQARTEAVQSQATADDCAPPNCKGQEHHPISRPIAKALNRHPKLKGLYKPRDPRLVARAVDEQAHCGYQDWHRKVDQEVISWLDENKGATPKEFEALLREIYSRPAMRARFPHGF